MIKVKEEKTCKAGEHYNGFLYAGGFWYSDDGVILTACNPDDINEWWTTAGLDNGKVTKETFNMANKSIYTPDSWTQNTLRSALKKAKKLGLIK